MALFALIALGQAAKQKEAFPFVAFTMYGDAPARAAAYYDYRAVHRSGREERFRPSQVVSTLGSARVARGLARRLDAARGAPPGDAAERLTADALVALMQLYNEDHSDDPVRAVAIEHVVLEPPYHARDARRELVATVQAEPHAAYERAAR